MSVATPLPATVAVPVPTVARLGGYAGLLCAAVLLVNAAKRAGLLPAVAFVQLLAPLAQLAALGLVTALFVVGVRRVGALALTGYVANCVALGLLVGVEFVLNLVFPYSDPAQVAALRSGPLGVALLVASVLFLVGTLVFVGTLLAGRRDGTGVPRWACVSYMLGGTLVALRAFVPELVLQVGLLALAAGVLGLAVWLLRAGQRPVAGGDGL